MEHECGLVWLDPMPFEQDIEKAYKTYHTHQVLSDPPETLARRVYCRIQESYLASIYGYQSPRRGAHGPLLGALMYLYQGGRARTDFSVFILLPNRVGVCSTLVAAAVRCSSGWKGWVGTLGIDF